MLLTLLWKKERKKKQIWATFSCSLNVAKEKRLNHSKFNIRWMSYLIGLLVKWGADKYTHMITKFAFQFISILVYLGVKALLWQIVPAVHPVVLPWQPRAPSGSASEWEQQGRARGQLPWFQPCLSLQTVGKTATVWWAHVFDITVTWRPLSGEGECQRAEKPASFQTSGVIKNTL